MEFIHLWRDDRALSKIICSTIPIPVHGFKVKVTDFEFFCVQILVLVFAKPLIDVNLFGMYGYDSKMLQEG